MTLGEQIGIRRQALLDELGLSRRHRPIVDPVFVAMLAFTAAFAPIMMYANLRYGVALALGALVAVLLLVLTARAPVFGFYALTFAAVVIEQDPLATPIGTDRLDVFSWPARFAGLPERPVGFYILFLFLVLIVIRLATRKGLALRGGALIWPMLAFLACVALGIVHGLATGGNFRIIVLEIRPFWYLFATYLIAYNLVTNKRHIMGFFWILVIGTFIKALQGCYIVITTLHGHISGANEIMAHEQSYFFIQILLLILLCLLMKRMRALMWVACASLPFLIIALMANNRRADYLAFLLGAIAVWVLAIKLNVPRRKALTVAFIGCSAIVGVYILVFGSISTPISQPANAIISVIEPSKADARDAASNLYRYFEDADLTFTAQQDPILGYGFGKPFLTPAPLPNIIGLDPYYLYIPHNNILWIWMRLGPVGYLAFWYLFAAAIVRGGVIMKRLRDPDLQVVAMFAIGAFIMEIPLAYGDYQIYFYRNIFITGMLMGMLMRLPAIDAQAQRAQEENEAREKREIDWRKHRVRVFEAISHGRSVPVERAPHPDDDPQPEPVGATTSSRVARDSAAPRLRARYKWHVWEPKS